METEEEKTIMSINKEEEPAKLSDADFEQTEQEKKDAAEAKAWLSNEKNINQARLLAKQVQNVCGKSWFSLEQARKKSGESKESVFGKLSLCGQFGFMAKKGEGQDTLFKVVLSVQDWILILRLFIQEHESQLKPLRHELRKLEAKLAAEEANGQS